MSFEFVDIKSQYEITAHIDMLDFTYSSCLLSLLFQTCNESLFKTIVTFTM